MVKLKDNCLILIILSLGGVTACHYPSKPVQAEQSSTDRVSVEVMEKEMYEDHVLVTDQAALNSRGERQARIEKARLKSRAITEARINQLRQQHSQYQDVPMPEMVLIPAGRFQMGCSTGENCRSNELPVHQVKIDAFELSATEITFAQWDACVADSGCDHYADDGRGRGRDNRPVVNVSWSDARQYVAWLSKKTGKEYRLPTEAEWEYAARSGSTGNYNWGEAPGVNQANCSDCGSGWDHRMAAPVASFAQNGYGLYDMHGNVYEWVEDCWHKSYQGAPIDGSAWGDAGNCRLRVRRGGSWNRDAKAMRASCRDEGGAYDFRDDNLGFRIARSIK